MGHCHAAIVLLTPKALESRWVLKEATILAWRRAMSPPGEFLLIPIRLNLTSEAIGLSDAFAPLKLLDIQSLRGMAGQPLAEKIAELLEPLREVTRPTPRRRMEDLIANQLARIGPAGLLEDVARTLGEDLGAWNPDRTSAGRLAMLMLQAPYDRVMLALEKLIGALPRESLSQLADWLKGFWVNPQLAGMLNVVAMGAEGTRVAALNSSWHEFTSGSLIARACEAPPFWISVPTAPAVGEDPAGSFVAQIRGAFLSFSKSASVDEKKQTAAISAFIDLQAARNRPIVVILPSPEGDQPLLGDDVVERILKNFPKCTLFLPTGDSLPPPGELEGVRRLAPELESGEELKAQTLYHAFLAAAGLS